VNTPTLQIAGAQIEAGGSLGAQFDEVNDEGGYITESQLTALLNNLTTGCIIAVWRYKGDHQTGPSTDSVIFNTEGLTLNDPRMSLKIQEPNGSGRIDFQLYQSASDQVQQRTSNFDVTGDKAWHMTFVNQPSDGTGIDIFTDRWENSQLGSIDPGDEDDWFDAGGFTSEQWDNFTMGYRAATGNTGATPDANSSADIQIDRFIITELPITFTEGHDLYDCYFGPPAALYVDGDQPFSTGHRGAGPYKLRETDVAPAAIQRHVYRSDGNTLFSSQIFSHTALSADGRFLAVALSSTGDRIETAEWDAIRQNWRRLPNSGWSSFKTAVDFQVDPGGNLLLLGIGEVATRQQLAWWNGHRFRIFSPDPFDVQHASNLFCAKFYNNGNNLAVAGNNVSGIRLRKYNRVAEDDWDDESGVSGIDVQPDSGGVQSGVRGGMAVSSTHLAVLTTVSSPAGATLAIYSYDSNGDLTLQREHEPAGTNDNIIGTWHALEFSPDGRYVYSFVRGQQTSLTYRRVWDRDTNNFDEVSSGIANADDGSPTDISITPDGRYLIENFAATGAGTNRIYSIAANGSLTEEYRIVDASNPSSTGVQTSAVSENFWSTATFQFLVESHNPLRHWRMGANTGNIPDEANNSDLVVNGAPGTYEQVSLDGRGFEAVGTVNNSFQDAANLGSELVGTVQYLIQNPSTAVPGSWFLDIYQGFDVDNVSFRHDQNGLVNYFTSNNVATGDWQRQWANLPSLVNATGFHLYTFVKRQSDLAPELYIDGARHYTKTDTPADALGDPGYWWGDFTDNIEVFNRGNPAGAGWGGTGGICDDIAIFNYALEESEIVEMAESLGFTVSVENINFETMVDEMHPRVLFKFDEASGALIDSGYGPPNNFNGNFNFDLTEIAAPSARQVTNGDQSSSGGLKAATLVESDGWAVALPDNALSNVSEQGNTLMFAFRDDGVATGVTWYWYLSDDAGANFCGMGRDNASSNFRYTSELTAGQGGEAIGPASNDDNWHIVFVVQRKNSNAEGVELYFDSRTGAETVKQAGSTWNASFLNQDIGDPAAAGATKIGMGAEVAVGLGSMLNGYSGEIDYWALFDEALTPEDIGRLTRKYLDGTQ